MCFSGFSTNMQKNSFYKKLNSISFPGFKNKKSNKIFKYQNNLFIIHSYNSQRSNLLTQFSAIL